MRMLHNKLLNLYYEQTGSRERNFCFIFSRIFFLHSLLSGFLWTILWCYFLEMCVHSASMEMRTRRRKWIMFHMYNNNKNQKSLKIPFTCHFCCWLMSIFIWCDGKIFFFLLFSLFSGGDNDLIIMNILHFLKSALYCMSDIYAYNSMLLSCVYMWRCCKSLQAEKWVRERDFIDFLRHIVVCLRKRRGEIFITIDLCIIIMNT